MQGEHLMSMETKPHREWRMRTLVRLAASALLCASPAWSQIPQSTLRNLTGTITESSNEPIRGAVVELRNERSNQIVTYLTDDTGAYTFRRLDGNTDYDVRVLFRGRHSPTRTISKFDDHMAKVIDFTMHTY